jgi:DNA-binding winged helix-turn-helix (wHTH) protein
VIRYRFSGFTLSPQRRILARDGREVPLIPRYFDLLVLLIERRHEAVHRREIFERVWTDATVSDSALSQAIRTLRRTLDDDSREPRFIRTVSRHGYRFVFPDVLEDADDGAPPAPGLSAPAFVPQEADVRARENSSAQSTMWHAARGGALAGIAAGGLGGLILAAAPGSTAPIAIAPVLAVIGGVCGALGGGGIGAGLFVAETHARAQGAVALIGAAAIGGGVVGVTVQWLARWSLSALMGLDVAVGGGLEGVAIGAAAGAGYALAARTESPGRAVAITALLCGLAGLALMLGGRPLVGGTIHTIAIAADGSRAILAPLGRLIGEPDFGPVSQSILAFGEAAVFGLGLAFGLRSRQSHRTLTPH